MTTTDKKAYPSPRRMGATQLTPAVFYDFVLKDEPICNLRVDEDVFCAMHRVRSRDRCNVWEPGLLSQYKQVLVNEIGIQILLEEQAEASYPDIEIVSEALQWNLCLSLYRQDAQVLETHFIAGTDTPLSEDYYLSECGVEPINPLPLNGDDDYPYGINRRVKLRSHINIHESPLVFPPCKSARLVLRYTGDLSRVNNPLINASIAVYVRGVLGRDIRNS